MSYRSAPDHAHLVIVRTIILLRLLLLFSTAFCIDPLARKRFPDRSGRTDVIGSKFNETRPRNDRTEAAFFGIQEVGKKFVDHGVRVTAKRKHARGFAGRCTCRVPFIILRNIARLSSRPLTSSTVTTTRVTYKLSGPGVSRIKLSIEFVKTVDSSIQPY